MKRAKESEEYDRAKGQKKPKKFRIEDEELERESEEEEPEFVPESQYHETDNALPSSYLYTVSSKGIYNLTQVSF